MSTVVNFIPALHPIARERFERLADYLQDAYEDGRCKTHFRPFETYRSPMRQAELFARRPKVTHANAWESSHQYGLAVDFVPYHMTEGWSWDGKHEWAFLKEAAERHGLVRPHIWDLAHIEHPAWPKLKKTLMGLTAEMGDRF